MTTTEKESLIIEVAESLGLSYELAKLFIAHMPENDFVYSDVEVTFDDYLNFMQMYSFVTLSYEDNKEAMCENANFVSDWNKIFKLPLTFIDYALSFCGEAVA